MMNCPGRRPAARGDSPEGDAPMPPLRFVTWARSARITGLALPAAVGLKAYVYSGTGYTFTEGDGTYTQHLLDGRLIWFFSDSFLGAVGSGGSRGPSGTPHWGV